MNQPVFARGQCPVTRSPASFYLDWSLLDAERYAHDGRLGDIRTLREVIHSPWRVFERDGVYTAVSKPAEQYLDPWDAVPASPHAIFVMELALCAVGIAGPNVTVLDCYWVYPWKLYDWLTDQEAESRYLSTLGKEVQHAA